MTIIISEKDLLTLKMDTVPKSYMLKKVHKNYSKGPRLSHFTMKLVVGNYLLSTDCVLSGQEGCSLCPRADFPSGRLPRRPFYQGLIGEHRPEASLPWALRIFFITAERTGPDRKRGLLSAEPPPWALQALSVPMMCEGSQWVSPLPRLPNSEY